MLCHPIIFSSESIRAILGGRKTQTRRIIKPQPIDVFFETDHYEAHWLDKANTHHFCNDLLLHCPYGQVGDRLWVKEKFFTDPRFEKPIYTTDYLPMKPPQMKWKSPLFMPRWASRILLEITRIRVERVQAITYNDIWAEGCPTKNLTNVYFKDLWNSLNAKRGYGWDKNPWVWVIEFKVLDTTKSDR